MGYFIKSCVFAGFLFLIWNGFETDTRTIVSCGALHERWIEAKYSETDIDLETETWKELASDYYGIYTLNGDLYTEANNPEMEKIAYLNNFGYYSIPYPPRDEEFATEKHFDKFERNYLTKVVVDFEYDNIESNRPSLYPKCMEKLNKGEPVTVTTWYGNIIGKSFD